MSFFNQSPRFTQVKCISFLSLVPSPSPTRYHLRVNSEEFKYENKRICSPKLPTNKKKLSISRRKSPNCKKECTKKEIINKMYKELIKMLHGETNDEISKQGKNSLFI